jgi:prepilin signal peptidase PulO-like enzyme (type II secretory pathway)
VPDRLSLPVLLAGLASAPLLGRLPEAFLGAALGFGLLLVPCLLDLAGGGDLKCAAALGAWCGPEGLARVLFVAVLCGALWAAAARLRRGELRGWLAVLFQGLLLRVFCGVRGAVPLPKLEEEGSVRNAVPFGACMCLAVWLAWAWGFLAGGGAIGAVFADYFGR